MTTTPENSVTMIVFSATADVIQQGWQDWTEGWVKDRAIALTIEPIDQIGVKVEVPTALAHELMRMAGYRGLRIVPSRSAS